VRQSVRNYVYQLGGGSTEIRPAVAPYDQEKVSLSPSMMRR
jgi:hypothetical protein